MNPAETELKVLEFTTYSQKNDSWPRMATGHINTANRNQLGKHPMVCMTETDADPKGNTATAERICKSFITSYQALEGMTPQDRLRHALQAANSELDELQNETGTPAVRTSVTAVAAHEHGIDYIAIGDGTIMLIEGAKGRKVRRTPQTRHTPDKPRCGLYGHEIDPENIDQGRLDGDATPGELIVMGTALLSRVDDEELTWVQNHSGNQMETMRSIADEVSAETGDRFPGVGLVSVANR